MELLSCLTYSSMPPPLLLMIIYRLETKMTYVHMSISLENKGMPLLMNLSIFENEAMEKEVS